MLLLDVITYFIADDTTKKDILVWDPFMGTGTTAYCCAEVNVKFLGSEKDTAVFHAATSRIAQKYTTIDPERSKFFHLIFFSFAKFSLDTDFYVDGEEEGVEILEEKKSGKLTFYLTNLF